MVKKTKVRTFIWDCETSYTVGAVWGLYDQNVATVLREPYMLTFSGKWLGEDKVFVYSLPDFPLYKKDKKNDRALIEKLRELFDEADIIIAHNGNSFDQKWAYARFAVHQITPPSPSQYIDTKLVAKSKFRFNSNSLNNLGSYFSIGNKIDTGGIQLWVDCIEHDKKEAWAKMCKYNKQDVVLLEKVYLHMLPYITNHPNLAVLLGERIACPNCGSNRMNKSKLRATRTGMKQQFQCQDCASYHSSPLKEGSQVR